MGGFVFQYGTALHLALLTVAPLFLLPVCDSWTGFIALFVLSLFGALWIVMNPSPHFGEWPRDARARIWREIWKDPFFFVCIAAIILSFVRSVNGGIELAYDAGQRLWRLEGPFVEILPGSVSGAGLVPLAGMIALTVVTLGVRHALGERARLAYLFLSSALAALAVGWWVFLLAHGASARYLTRCSETSVFLGSVLGVFLLFAIIAWIESWSRRSVVLQLLTAGAAAGVLFGLIRFSPILSLYVFCFLTLVLLSAGVFFAGVRQSPISWLRRAVGFFIILSPLAIILLEPPIRSALWPVLTERVLAVREAASSVALAAWRDSSRMGAGLDSFPVALQFYASPAHWQVLSPFQTGVPNGWVQFLFERGFLGCAVLLVGAFFLAKDVTMRFVRAPRGWHPSVAHLAGPAVLAGVVAVTFFESTFVQLALLVPLCAALALSTAELPEEES